MSEHKDSDNIVNRIEQISLLLSKEVGIVNNDIQEKYDSFKKWLSSNGAIFPNIEFPIQYSSVKIIGCKTTKQINPNTAILYIPYKLIIDSNKIDIKTEHNSLKLTLFLLGENDKKEKSFWREYIDLILMNNNNNPFILDCYENYKNELNKELLNGIVEYEKEIKDLYQKSKDMSYNYKYDIFKKIYLFVVSRQFYLDDKSILLIPLADLINHSPKVDVKYEFFDSVNYVMKFTALMDEDHKDRNMKYYTDCRGFFECKKEEEKTNSIKEITIDIGRSEDEPYDRDPTNDDYFVISTNSEEVFRKDEQIFNNYGKNSNLNLFIIFGFCLLDNKNDYTKVQFTIPLSKDDLELSAFISQNFANEIIDIQEKKISLVFQIQKNKVCVQLFKLFKQIYFKKDVKTKKIALNIVLDELINYLNEAIKKNEININELLNDIEASLQKSEEFVPIMLKIFKFTQQLNLLIQKELFSCLKDLIKMSSKSTKNIILSTLKKNTNEFEPKYISKEQLVFSLTKFINKNIL